MVWIAVMNVISKYLFVCREDDKYGRRERGGHSGPLVDFREKGGFRPNIKLEYVDDDGHPLCPKEAFRYLSHKFHGKGPGKNKQEKRIKKQVQEGVNIYVNLSLNVWTRISSTL